MPYEFYTAPQKTRYNAILKYDTEKMISVAITVLIKKIYH